VADTALISSLHEVITALDARRRRPERPAEAAIARDAAELRAEAVDRLITLGAVPPTPVV
jgi:hypothetical protein